MLWNDNVMGLPSVMSERLFFFHKKECVRLVMNTNSIGLVEEGIEYGFVLLSVFVDYW